MRSLVLLGALAATAGAQPAIEFRSNVQPILEQQCLGCHDANKAAGGLRIVSRESVLKSGSVVPGKPEQSRLYTALELPSGKPGAMPPGGPQLPKEQREAIRQWIASGAEWPANLTLSTAPAAGSAKDDEALVEQVRKRIVANSKEKTAAEMKPYRITIPNTDVSFDMVPIPGGEFTMGTPDSEKGRRKDEGPERKVKIDPFWMAKYEVTWDEYRLFMFANLAKENANKDAVVDAISRPTKPYVEMSFGMGLNGYPAISMTQHAANKYAEWLSAKTGQFYRLPTEAEWEYACRAGTTTAYSFGDDPSQLGEYAWLGDNSDGKYQQVGKKKPNPWGLYDMHGNVMEWTLDQYAPYQPGPADNPWVKQKTPYPQVTRGGSWMDTAKGLRCGARVGSDPSWKMQDPQLPKSIWYLTDAQGVGFRLVRPLKVPSAAEMYRYWNNGVEKE